MKPTNSIKNKIQEKEKLKELRLKIKRENYNLFKELGDKQAGELIKGMCAYMYDGKPFFTKDPYLKGAFMGIKKEYSAATRRMFLNLCRKARRICA